MKKIFLIIILVFSFFYLIPNQVGAAGFVPCGGYELDGDGNPITAPLESPVPSGWRKTSETEMTKLEPPCQLCHIFVLFDNILDFIFFKIVPPLAILMIAIGGLYFLFSSGNPSTLAQGKTILKYTAIGLLIIYGAYLVINMIFLIIGVADWTGLRPDPATGKGWFQIDCPTP